MAGRTFKEFCEQKSIRDQKNALNLRSIKTERIRFYDVVSAELDNTNFYNLIGRIESSLALRVAERQKHYLDEFGENRGSPKQLVKVRLNNEGDLLNLARLLYVDLNEAKNPQLSLNKWGNGDDIKYKLSAIAFQIDSTTIQSPDRWLTYYEVLNHFPNWDEQLQALFTTRSPRTIESTLTTKNNTPAEVDAPLTNAELLARALESSPTQLGNYYSFEAQGDRVVMQPREIPSVVIKPAPIEDTTIAKIIVETLNDLESKWNTDEDTYLKFQSGASEFRTKTTQQIYPTDIDDQQRLLLIADIAKHLNEPRHFDSLSPQFQTRTEAASQPGFKQPQDGQVESPKPRPGGGFGKPGNTTITPTTFESRNNGYLFPRC